MRFLAFLTFLLLVPGAAAQSIARADSFLAQGDTSAAIDALEQLIRREFRNAEARWRVGQLYMSRHRPGTDLSPNRRRAEEHFRYATRFEPDSAKYRIALADLFRGEDWMMTRVQVAGLVEDAIAAAERTADTASLAAASYRAGRVEFERWEQYGNRWEVMSPGTPSLSEEVLHSDWRQVEDYYRNRIRPIPDAGDQPRRAAETHLRRSVEFGPTNVDAMAKLVVLLGAQDRWSEAYEVARTYRRENAESGPFWALQGLTLARMGRWPEAERMYARALELMTPEERAPYEDLSGILRAGDRVRWEQMGAAARRDMAALYWDLGQPLMLTEAHETRTEYYARITYTRARWSAPERAIDGARTDRGVVYVRFGPPDLEAGLTWIYWPSRLRFSFTMTPGFANARLSPLSNELFRQVERDAPGRFDNIPLMRTLDTVITQVAQFRGDSGRTDVAVFGWIPVDRMVGNSDLASVQVTTAAILRNDGGEVDRVRRTETVNPRDENAIRHRSWRFGLPAGDFYLRLEALASVLNAGARHSEIMRVRSYAAPIFQLSDLLLARRVAPQDSTASRWTDFFIEPSAGRIEPGEPLSLLWEQYHLAPSADGTARWHVELRVTVTAIERRDFVARIIGGVGDAVGASALGDDRISLSWDREARVPPGGTVTEYVTLDFGDAPAEAYEITVLVTDRVSGRTVERTRTLVRSTTEARRP